MQLAAASYTTLSAAPARMSLTSASTSPKSPGTVWRGTGGRRSTRSSSPSSITSRSSANLWNRSSSVTDGPITSSLAWGTRATARMIVSRPFAGDVRPSASSVSSSRAGRSTHGRSETSIPWPIATSFVDDSGNVRSSTLSTLVESRSAVESSRLRRQCVNHSRMGTRSGFATGAARTA